METAMRAIAKAFITMILVLGFGGMAAAQDAPMEVAGAKTVNAREIISLIEKTSNLVLLDNRQPQDFAAGHIEGAVRLLDTDINADSLAKAIPTKATPVLFYCNGLKCGRAAKAAEAAGKMGYTAVYYYALGMDEWRALGLPLAK
jgi:rhodanese-related sulfurtransferase